MIDDLKSRYDNVYEQISDSCEKVGRNPSDITLITVTKTNPSSVLQEVLDTGNSHIGENRVQEIVEKIPLLRGDKTVHLIGHLQSNKARKVIPLIDWMHSVDSEKLVLKIDQLCEEFGKKLNVLVQVNTSSEDAKSGCDPDMTLELCEKVASCYHLNFRGLMTIGLWKGSELETRSCFSKLRLLGERCSNLVEGRFELSMGMSGDFDIAIEEGATMIRVGSLILGQRRY